MVRSPRSCCPPVLVTNKPPRSLTGSNPSDLGCQNAFQLHAVPFPPSSSHNSNRLRYRQMDHFGLDLLMQRPEGGSAFLVPKKDMRSAEQNLAEMQCTHIRRSWMVKAWWLSLVCILLKSPARAFLAPPRINSRYCFKKRVQPTVHSFRSSLSNDQGWTFSLPLQKKVIDFLCKHSI